MSHNETRSNQAMRHLSDEDLASIIKSGSLRHAAARYELNKRNRPLMLRAAIAYWPPR